MTEKTKNATSRRDFIKNTSRIAAASALAGAAIPRVHAAEDNTIRLALVGCGGRGSGAVANAMAAGGLFIELMIHQIDECFWIKDAWPIAAHGVGGRFAGSTDCSQNLDSYSIEYTFADGTKAMVTGRYIRGCANDFATYIHGTKCAAQFSGNIHAPKSQIYKDQQISRRNVAWKPQKEKANPWQAEWTVLLGAIRDDRPHNEARRAALSNLGAIMGRAAVHTGKIVTWEEAMASTFRFCPNVAELTADSPAPVQANAEGRYPAPVPGVWQEI